MILILLHGLGQDASSWAGTKRCLKESFDVQSPELYGGDYGYNFSYQKIYEQFEEYCETFSEPIYLCGLSLGGILCLNYALEHSDKVQKLILIGTQYKMPKHLLRIQNFAFRCMPDKVFRKFNLTKHDVIRLCKSMMDLDFSNKLQHLACDTLVVCGEKDRANLSASKRVSERIKKAAMVKIPNSGHEVNQEQAHKLAEVICKFLQV